MRAQHAAYERVVVDAVASLCAEQDPKSSASRALKRSIGVDLAESILTAGSQASCTLSETVGHFLRLLCKGGYKSLDVVTVVVSVE